MRYMDRIKGFMRGIKRLFRKKEGELQPKDILARIMSELERKKKYGIGEKAFVPNAYVVYLSPFDYEEISPLLSGIREQLVAKVTEKVRKENYSILSAAVTIDIREDTGLLKGQIVVESSFLKEKTRIAQAQENITILPNASNRGPAASGIVENGNTEAWDILRDAMQGKKLTKIIEDKKTRIIDNTRVRLEIIDGRDKGDVITLQEGEYTFGRGSEAHLLIQDENETVSRVHFRLVVREGRIRIEDLGSTNGTKVNDIEIEEAVLSKGDVIAAGKVMLKVA